MSESLVTLTAPVWRFGRGSMARSAAAAVTLTALADWLFYDQDIGISAVIFLVFAGIAFAACLRHALVPGRCFRAALVLIAAALPWVVDVGWIQYAVSVSGCAIASAILTLEPGADVFSAAARSALGMGWQIVPDFAQGAMAMRAARRGKWSPADAFIWVVPAGLGLVFLALFAAANPIIADAVVALNPAALLNFLFSFRFWFWLGFAACLWPFLMPRLSRPRTARIATIETQSVGIWSVLLGRAAVLRSLIAFNLLFALQTVMDVDYLWLGHALPDGTDYADYAHQGAYPLIITALLAGAFTLVATRPGSAAADSKLVRVLVLGWILQNVLLVFSAILRLKLYVDVYQLTELRLAALIWMLLVAGGLILILARMALKRSNVWLVQANAVALAATLYACSFVNFANVVSMYDVKHCYELSGGGQSLDVDYVASLGPQAIPALDLYQIHTVKPNPGKPFAFLSTGYVGETRDDLAAQFLADQAGWRGWNIWRWHLAKYLMTHQSDG